MWWKGWCLKISSFLVLPPGELLSFAFFLKRRLNCKSLNSHTFMIYKIKIACMGYSFLVISFRLADTTRTILPSYSPNSPTISNQYYENNRVQTRKFFGYICFERPCLEAVGKYQHHCCSMCSTDSGDEWKQSAFPWYSYAVGREENQVFSHQMLYFSIC